jgi:hypothetical protein
LIEGEAQFRARRNRDGQTRAATRREP